MPKGIVKAVVLVDDLDAVVRLLGGVVGAEPVESYESTGEQAAVGLGWPADRGATRGAIVGRPPGMLELVEIPPGLRGEVEPGVALLSYGSRDVEGRSSEARAAGFAVHGPRDIVGVDGTTSTLARIDAGGVSFELIRYST
ncbi:MAG TPA: hypothetical protein VFC99_17355 [Acidimicrobiia bacterium]|nr:hypothetical protein [Acidimicrobiia bacterium]